MIKKHKFLIISIIVILYLISSVSGYILVKIVEKSVIEFLGL